MVESKRSLYDEIGGAPALDAAVEEFYRRVLGDPMLAGFFGKTDLTRLKAHQRAFFTMALRGGGSYNGRTMRAAHQGRGIADAHFDRVAMHLSATLFSLGVSEKLVGGVIGAIAPLRAEVVDEPASEKAA
jgi:hemoglobin